MTRFVKFPHVRIITGIILGLIFAGMLGSSFAKLYDKKQRLQDEISRVEEEIGIIKKENEKLEELLGDSAAASAMLEKEARRRLNLKKPGEKLIIIVPLKGEENQELRITNQEFDGEQLSWWQKIFTFLRLKK